MGGRIHLRLIPESSVEDERPEGCSGGWQQLNLFDFTPVNVIYCVPMIEVHGYKFERLFNQIRPKFTVDLREFPYFNLDNLDRKKALDIIRDNSGAYFHHPMRLKHEDDLSKKWEIRKATIMLFSGIAQSQPDGCKIVSLVNSLEEIDELARYISPTSISEEKNWKIETVI